MNKQKQFDNKYKSTQQQQQNDDDEQIEKTLNFFDAILDPYLNDEDIIDEKSDHQVKLTSDIIIQEKKHDFNGLSSTNTNISPSSHPHSHYEPIKFAAPTRNVRRYTSENNLNQITSPSKPTGLIQKTSLPPPVRTTAVSTEDLSTVPLWKKYSPQTRHSVLLDKTNGASASLIDLTSIDKPSSRPRFRFIPPSNQNLIIKEESENQQQQQRSNPKSDQVHNNGIPSNRISLNNQTKYSHPIVKPTVIIPPKPKSAPINRLIESNIHHQNGNSAFKPPRSSKNGVLSKFQPVLNTKPIQKPNVHIGITNPKNHLSNTDFLLRQQHMIPQFHQSMLNLSSIGIPETGNTNQLGSRMVYQPTSSNFMRPPPPYTPQSNQINRHSQYPPPPPIFDDSNSRWIQPVNNSSNTNGVVYSSYNQPFTNGGGGNRSQQQAYPYNPYTATNSGLSPPVNTYDHLRRHQPYFNPIHIHSPQYSTPVHSLYLTSMPVSKHGIFPSTQSNIYHFNQNNSSREGQSRHNPYRQNTHVTTYL